MGKPDTRIVTSIISINDTIIRLQMRIRREFPLKYLYLGIAHALFPVCQQQKRRPNDYYETT